MEDNHSVARPLLREPVSRRPVWLQPWFTPVGLVLFPVVAALAVGLFLIQPFGDSQYGTSLGGRPQRKPNESKNGHRVDCSSRDFARQTFRVLDEYPIARLLFRGGVATSGGLSKFEASDVAGIPSFSGFPASPYFVVFDNSFEILRLGVEFSASGNSETHLMAWPGDNGAESQFEALAYNATSNSFLAIQEVVSSRDGLILVSRVFDISFRTDRDVQIIVNSQCMCDFPFSSENKGFEGAVVIHHPVQNTSYLVALCEGNHCDGGRRGREPGNGRLIVLARRQIPDPNNSSINDCWFEAVDEIRLPKSINFVDYSGMTVYFNENDSGLPGEHVLAISSQENSAVWIGTIRPGSDSPSLFEIGDGVIYDFPPDDDCQPIYCNVEGIHFVSNRTLIAVSDAMKGKGKQDFRCWGKAESIHLLQF
mmetsp:Transcript_8211/g.16615  ORF Transcript_8211/g.16615 Transcript_8211/m.16615 type:complete len:423 (-) Transcript_8211:206-1474(-)|eukprot:CAMPEP_0184690020 /NCGR_PEP_ID=MMETSP0312-20130426/30982_1 /TAXON_ID=31354 /ORGANISM="Compsopogon coeruleus, Strain SAG 36.94" /LENGTH=422 /DNA_ID=CAMNT_0027147439 /DNA_START=127 /DNA_END=1395 /DNA_ORIENTATION=+